MPNTIELAWAAGFFDGEGSVGFRVRSHAKSSPGRSISVQIGQVHREPLDRFQEAVGVGNVRGPYTRDNPRHQPSYKYSVSGGRQVYQVFKLIGPYLSTIKRDDFLTALRGWLNHETVWTQCEHGNVSVRCSLCHRRRAHKGWITRRQYAQ